MESSEVKVNNEKVYLRNTLREKQNKFLKRSKTLQVSTKRTGHNIDISIYPNKYAHPIIETPKSSNDIVINQEIPTILVPVTFSVNPVKLICPFCNNEILSEIDRKFNCGTCCFFLILGLLCILPCLFCAGLCHLGNVYCDCDCTCCYDATHICPNCRKVVGTHDSCPC